MRGTPKVGMTGEQIFVVELRHAIDFADGCMPAVLCTPWLIWFLEHAAREAVLPVLEPGESTWEGTSTSGTWRRRRWARPSLVWPGSSTSKDLRFLFNWKPTTNTNSSPGVSIGCA